MTDSKIMFWIEARRFGSSLPGIPERVQWTRLWGHESHAQIVSDLAECRRSKPDEVFRLIQVTETVLDAGGLKEIWIGRESLIRKVAPGYPDITAITRSEKLLGYKGPLKVNLVGNCWELSDWENIHRELQRLKRLGVIAEFQNHAV